MFTPLHRVLGVGPTPDLTYGMLVDAVAGKVVETAELEWKKALPGPGPDGNAEIAKDFAAMANSGGGMIVYGVAEDGEARAEDLHDIGETGPLEQRLRLASYSGARPAVTTSTFWPLGTDGGRALAVVIRASRDAPHLVHRQDQWFRVPVRNGRHRCQSGMWPGLAQLTSRRPRLSSYAFSVDS
jgi:predicted HTH transcriptional regulator